MNKREFKGTTIKDSNEVIGSFIDLGTVGAFIVQSNSFLISMETLFEVHRDSVSQSIGVRDKNGKMIFENDRIKLSRGYKTLPKSSKYEFVGLVIYDTRNCRYVLSNNEKSIPLFDERFNVEIEVLSKDSPILKTSAEWQKTYEFLILDPDGWDRKNYDYSWHEELISQEEFNNRAMMSTVRLKSQVQRIQRKRIKGFKLPENTICVSRPNKFGNPYKIEDYLLKSGQDLERKGFYGQEVNERLVANAYNLMFQAYRNHLYKEGLLEAVKTELKGKNLACWCALDKQCHADVLLEIANS